MSSYKNPVIIPPFQSRVALVENLWNPPKSTEFSSLLGAPPHYSNRMLLRELGIEGNDNAIAIPSSAETCLR